MITWTSQERELLSIAREVGIELVLQAARTERDHFNSTQDALRALVGEWVVIISGMGDDHSTHTGWLEVLHGRWRVGLADFVTRDVDLVTTDDPPQIILW